MAIELEFPGDKSLAHRYLIFDFLSGGKSILNNLPQGQDVGDTKICLERIKNNKFTLDCGNSGTTARLLTGILTGTAGRWELFGDASLSARPMKRVVDPLIQFGAKISTPSGKLPLTIEASKINPIDYELPVPSAQVKSALLLAGLIHNVPVRLTGKIHTRDHTEIFLKEQGLNINVSDHIYFNDKVENLKPFEVNIPGDPSSACFLIIKRILNPGKPVFLKNILLNPTRVYYLELLKKIGASLEVKNSKLILGEQVGDIHIEYRPLEQLHNIPEINQSALFIDEIPALSLLMTQIQGDCVINNVEELEVKESNRVTELQNMFAAFKIQKNLMYKDGNLKITGQQNLKNNLFISHDHRIQMAAALIYQQNISESIKVSFPNFEKYVMQI